MKFIVPSLFFLFAISSTFASGIDHTLFDKVLTGNVRDTLIDYRAIRDHQYENLTKYLDQIFAADLDALPRDEQIATYINLYNAGMIKAVIDRYRSDYAANEEKGKIYTEPLFTLGGKPQTLNYVEHEVLRKRFQDPRVHAALVCAGISCPPLRPRAYTAENLDAQLDTAMRSWLNDPRFNRIEPEKKRLRLSKIFSWYADDFGGKEKLAEYVAKYSEVDVRGFTVIFLQYDFRLNDTNDEGKTP